MQSKYNPNRYHLANNSGRFNKRIMIHGPVVKQDAIGNEVESFEQLDKLWSKIKTLKGSEYFAAAQTNATNVTRFVVRYSQRLDELFQKHKTKLEIHYKQVVYDVQSVINDDELNQTFTIIAKGRL